ncbi:MAG: bifunctional (p)ppGpp synthetase/guanosine-3',5'-bis(diphosphate) 3'-pyrophosphohydrolase [Bdellovibrio sp.]|nr:MAG: bifunctional (p)ppGpp synthetase/guanosine-3',5'-bis(diphosphate) 3'-pyrophosphohydrolase [Bdellovibrio sp.]
MVESLSRAPLFSKTPEGFDELEEKIKDYYSPAQIDLLREAYEFSAKAHEGQIRRSGEPYITHPLGVTAILADLRLDIATLVTGILHDTVEDTEVTLEDIEEHFGPVIRDLVDGVTKISQMQFRHTHEKQGENIRKMIVATGKDVRVILVKLADRLHNMRTLNHMPYSKQSRIAQETLDIYAPLAGRLGIMSMKVELEDLSFRYLHPDQYYELAQKVSQRKQERQKYIDEVIELLTKEIQARSQISFKVYGRPKHLYSIFKKMQARGVDYEQVYDVLAFRVIVQSVAECYEVLGIVHSLWKPIPGRFKDFIAMPKTNNYQSLHTTVIGPKAERIEVQIRTEEMNLVAEWGIAAHWKYKESSRMGNDYIDEATLKKFNWLRELVSFHQNTRNSDEFLENIKTDLVETEIYVFTPKGEVKEFPDGATPIDFAYAIHTQLGDHIVAARVNGRIVPLKYKLQNGDTVEVITSKNQKPSKDWLKICVTSKAKSKIRAFVKSEQRRRSLELGKELLEKTFRKQGESLQKHLKGPEFEKFLKEEGCANVNELYVRVGYGKITPKHVVEKLLPGKKAEEELSGSYLAKAFKSALNRSKKSSSVITVDGMNDVLVRYAKCCHPIPGDPIVGFISRGRGITVHRADCEKTFEMDQERLIDVEWNRANKDSGRIVCIRVVSHDIPGLLKSMTEVFSAHGVNIHNAQIRTTKERKAICIFDVSVRDIQQLTEVMTALEKVKGIIGVTRMLRN